MEVSPSHQPRLTVFTSDLKKRMQLALSFSRDSEIPNWQGQDARKLHEAV